MKAIRSLAELEAFGRQIASVRQPLQSAPTRTFWSALKTRQAYEAVAVDNETAYASLPQSLMVDSKIGKLLLSLFMDHLTAEQALQDKLQSPKRAVQFLATAVTAIFVPSPPTLIALAAAYADNYLALDQHQRDVQQLARDADQSMKHVLGSYGLTRQPSRRSFLLTRGTWFVFEVREWVYASQCSGSYTVWHTAIQHVGVDPSLVLPSQRHLITRYDNDPGKSPNVGRWFDR